MTPPNPSNPLTLAEQRYAITTWRYLRMSIVALLLSLIVAVGFERWKVHPGCFQESISAYYYTPARGVVIGALIAVGACLVCVKGNIDIENGLLNLAGILAPAVALVPTPNPGRCSSVLGTTVGRKENIANNGFTLLVVGLIAIIAATLVLVLARRSGEPSPSLTTWLGQLAAFVVWLVAVVVFIGYRSTFVGNAHYASAIALGVCIFLVVIINAHNVYKTEHNPPVDTAMPTLKPWRQYVAIAALMVLAVVATIIMELAGWDYWLLFIELAIAGLFAIFWAVQTAELWHDGLR
jgi:hypothetical protein